LPAARPASPLLLLLLVVVVVVVVVVGFFFLCFFAGASFRCFFLLSYNSWSYCFFFAFSSGRCVPLLLLPPLVQLVVVLLRLRFLLGCVPLLLQGILVLRLPRRGRRGEPGAAAPGLEATSAAGARGIFDLMQITTSHFSRRAFKKN
jgi:hypothetical protein